MLHWSIIYEGPVRVLNDDKTVNTQEGEPTRDHVLWTLLYDGAQAWSIYGNIQVLLAVFLRRYVTLSG
jgi:hypothetical protein